MLMVEIGELAVSFVHARRDRMAARRVRQAAVRTYREEEGEMFDDNSDHPRGYSAGFIKATAAAQAAYDTALRGEKSQRQKLYRAIARHDAATKEQPA